MVPPSICHWCLTLVHLVRVIPVGKGVESQVDSEGIIHEDTISKQIQVNLAWGASFALSSWLFRTLLDLQSHLRTSPFLCNCQNFRHSDIRLWFHTPHHKYCNCHQNQIHVHLAGCTSKVREILWAYSTTSVSVSHSWYSFLCRAEIAHPPPLAHICQVPCMRYPQLKMNYPSLSVSFGILTGNPCLKMNYPSLSVPFGILAGKGKCT